MNSIDVFAERLRDYANTNSHGLVYEFSNESCSWAETVKFTDRSRNIAKYFKVDFLVQHPVAAADNEKKKRAAEIVNHKFNLPTDRNRLPYIKQVIFNDPATIVYWADGTRTVVKCQDGDIYDPEKGLAMAISKKALGNKGNYCDVFKHWLPEEEVKTLEQRRIDEANKVLHRAIEIWQREYSEGRNNHGGDSAI